MFMTKRELDLALEKHKEWLEGKESGNQLKLVGVDFVRMVLKGKDLSKAIFTRCNFLECDLSESIFSDVVITSCEFIKCDFSSSLFKNGLIKHCTLSEIDWSSSNIEGTCISLGTATNVNFHNSKLHKADFFNTRIEDCDFSNTTCSEIGHLHLFSFSWIGDELETFVYLHNQDTVWFKGYKGPLAEFVKDLHDKKLGVSSTHSDILMKVCLMLLGYSDNKEQEKKWRTHAS